MLQLFGFRCYKLSGSLDFAALGVYFPPIVKEESQDETFIFNVIPGDECGYLLISYIPNSNAEKNEISIIDNIYREGTSEYMKQIVENIVLDQTENIILSPRIDEERLKEIAKHFLISSRYSAVINYMPISEQYKIMLAKKMDIFRKNRMVLFENHEQF